MCQCQIQAGISSTPPFPKWVRTEHCFLETCVCVRSSLKGYGPTKLLAAHCHRSVALIKQTLTTHWLEGWIEGSCCDGSCCCCRGHQASQLLRHCLCIQHRAHRCQKRTFRSMKACPPFTLPPPPPPPKDSRHCGMQKAAPLPRTSRCISMFTLIAIPGSPYKGQNGRIRKMTFFGVKPFLGVPLGTI